MCYSHVILISGRARGIGEQKVVHHHYSLPDASCCRSADGVRQRSPLAHAAHGVDVANVVDTDLGLRRPCGHGAIVECGRGRVPHLARCTASRTLQLSLSLLLLHRP